MAALERYRWPGNIRELEHLIERAVILSSGSELRVPMLDLIPIALPDNEALPATASHLTLRDNERELIRRALDDSGWVVGGPTGAAARLGMKRTTLLSRIKKLGLRRPERSGVDGTSLT